MLMRSQERACLEERALNLDLHRAWLIPRGVTLGKSSCLPEPALEDCLEGVMRQHCSTYGLTKMLMTYWYEKAGYQKMCAVGPHYCETQKNSGVLYIMLVVLVLGGGTMNIL